MSTMGNVRGIGKAQTARRRVFCPLHTDVLPHNNNLL